MGDIPRSEVDGGEGGFTKVCALYGYYQFSADVMNLDVACPSLFSAGPGELVVHFYPKSGQCVADVVFMTSTELICVSGAVGSSVVGNVYQQFVDLGAPATLDVMASSQTEPYLFFSGGECIDSTPMVGVPVEDVNDEMLARCHALGSGSLPF